MFSEKEMKVKSRIATNAVLRRRTLKVLVNGKISFYKCVCLQQRISIWQHVN